MVSENGRSKTEWRPLDAVNCIQEPFWELTNSLKDAYYISVNSEYQFLPEFIEDKGIAILGDIGTVLKDLRKAKEERAFV